MARDVIHEGIKQAFINDGWTILEDPLQVDLIDDDTFFEIDLSVEKILETGEITRLFAIEIKSFNRPSLINSFHEALGQFLNYKAALAEGNYNHHLYIAVSELGWEKLAEVNFIQRRIRQFGLQFIIVDIDNKKIIKWLT